MKNQLKMLILILSIMIVMINSGHSQINHSQTVIDTEANIELHDAKTADLDGNIASGTGNEGSEDDFICHPIEMGSLQFPDNADFADFDNDGLLDIYIGTSGQIASLESTPTTHVAWYKNLGDGSYEKRAVYAADVLESAARDFDNDGDVDILYANTSGENQDEITKYAILVNDGNGNFLEEIVIQIDAGLIKKLQVVDFNNDGLWDFYIEKDVKDWFQNGPVSYTFNDRGSSIVAFFNQGSFNFLDRTINRQDHNRTSEILISSNHGDVNGDGFLDVVVHFFSNELDEHWVTWNEFDKEDSFIIHDLPRKDYQNIQTIYIEDVDNDGDMDIGRFQTFQELIWFANDGNNNFGQFSDFEENAIFFPIEIDFDGDGDIDRMRESGTIWQENMDNQFLEIQPLNVDFDPSSKTSFFDVDNDGDIDIVYSDPPGLSNTEDQIHILYNDGDQNFGNEYVLDGYHYWPESMKVADFDGDGDDDIVVAHTTEEFFYWYQNDGNQNFTKILIQDLFQEGVAVDYADFDLDGDLDFITLEGRLSAGFRIWENDGNGDFSTEFQSGIEIEESRVVEIFDHNFDGYPDLIISDIENDQIVLLVNNQDLTFTQVEVSATNVEARSMAVKSFLNNGFEDLIIADAITNQLLFYRNNEGEGFQRSVIGSTIGSADNIKVEDLDNDGDYDIISASYPRDENEGGRLVFWVNNGTNIFLPFNIGLGSYDAITCGDYDQDGDIDIISADYNVLDNSIRLWRQEGFLVFTEITLDNNFFNGQSLVSIDLNNDGSLDLVGASNGSGLKWYENNFDKMSTTLSIVCPEQIVLSADGDGTVVFWEEPEAVTDCDDQNIEIMQTAGPENGSAFPIGITTITYVATDLCNNEKTCSFEVVIEETSTLDIICPEDIFLSTTGESVVATWNEPTFETTCEDELLIDINQVGGPPSGSEFLIGSTLITYEVSNECDLSLIHI